MLRIVKLHIKPQKEEAFTNLFLAHKPKLLKMPGCRSVTLVRDQQADNQFMTISEWSQDVDLENYRKSPLFLSVWQAVKPMFLEKAQVQSLDVVSSDLFKIST